MGQPDIDDQADCRLRTGDGMLVSYPGAFRHHRNRRPEKTGVYSFRLSALRSIFRLSTQGRWGTLEPTRIGRRTENRNTHRLPRLFST